MKSKIYLLLSVLFVSVSALSAATGTSAFPACGVRITHSDITCNGACNGSATAMGTGGAGHYTYSWNTGASGASLASLCPGTYTVNITDSLGCMSSDTVTVFQPAVVSATIVLQKNVSCHGMCDGALTLGIKGGTPPYSYSWSPNGGSGSSAANLCAGTYTLMITDSKGCGGGLSPVITEPPPFAAHIIRHTDLKCGGQCQGTAKASASGGNAPYAYSWTPAGGIRDSARRLCAGITTVTVRDTNGCVSRDSVNIKSPPPLVLSPSQHNVRCNGGSDGIAFAAVAGGTGPYTYTWLPALIPFGLKAGYEICIATDSNGCRVTHAYNITQPPAIVATVSSKPATCATCFNGRDSVTASGGIAPFFYFWNPGGCTTPLCSNLAPGTYTCCITDSAGCQLCQSTTLGVLGIAEAETPALSVFPNPTGNQLNIQFPAQFDIHRLSVFNSIGQCLMEIPELRYSRSIDISALPSGTYLLRLYYPEGSLHKLFIKQ